MTGVWVYMVAIVHAGGCGAVGGELEGVLEVEKKNGIVKRERRPRKRRTSVCTLGIRFDKIKFVRTALVWDMIGISDMVKCARRFWSKYTRTLTAASTAWKSCHTVAPSS